MRDKIREMQICRCQRQLKAKYYINPVFMQLQSSHLYIWYVQKDMHVQIRANSRHAIHCMPV